MKPKAFLFSCLGLFFGLHLAAQVRYLEEVFPEVAIDTGIEYATNISIFSHPNGVEDTLHFDLYRPIGDPETERPLVVCLHSGLLLPKQFNSKTTGAKDDYAVQEICTRLAKMGYVTAAIEFRQGWNPNYNTGLLIQESLFQANYRAAQDLRSFVRYIRRSVAEEGNPYGIHPEKMAAWGDGTGGFVALSAATLTQEEVFLPKFMDANGIFFIDTLVIGNVEGDASATHCLPNHVGFPSNLQFVFSASGLLYDSSWLAGEVPPIIAAHVVKDSYPFGVVFGPPLQATCESYWLPFGFLWQNILVSGPKCYVPLANNLGINDPILQDEWGEPLIFDDPVSLAIAQYFLAEPNLWPIWTEGFESEPWRYWDEEYWSNVPHPSCGALPFPECNFHTVNLLSNPDMSLEKSNRYIDSLVAFFAPRACFALGLQCDGLTPATEFPNTVPAHVISVQPNPSGHLMTVTLPLPVAGPGRLEVCSMAGQVLLSQTTEGNQAQLDLTDLPTGLHWLRWEVKGQYHFGKIIRG